MASNLITKILRINNMTCVNCENIIEKELSQTSGIESVKASYSTGTATVTYDESIISIEKIEEVLEKLDYQVGKNEADMYQKEDKKAPPATASKKFDTTDAIAVGVIIFALYMLAKRFGLLNIFNQFPVAKEGMGYGMLFLIGALTSVHCVAMCGGICLSQCVPQKDGIGTKLSKFAAMRPSFLYNLGRVISYTIIGGIIGAIGSVVSFSGTMKGIVQILAGVFMLIMGLNMLNIFPWLRKFNPRMPKIFAKKIYAQRRSNSPFYIGLLNGLMPCGPLQAMQLYALSTGSPVKGAISMFLFSIGTVPLLFAFGALSSFLSKKFTSKMMTASAVLVMVLGIFMLNNGIGLSGFAFPSISSASSNTSQANVATIKDGVQVVTTGLSSGSYEPIVVQKGIPVKWIIQAEDGDINGCNRSIVVSKYSIKKDLAIGDNVIEFTPTESGTVPFSCWMGMIRSKITVVEDLKNVDSNVIADSSTSGSTSGSCCTGGATGSTSGSNNSVSYNSNSGGVNNYNNLLDVKIPTDQLAVAEITDGVQNVNINYDENGFSPAIVVVQRGLKTVWIINGKNVSDKTILFPAYSAKLEIKEGENPVKFSPEQDFDFYTSEGTYYGYVKVVDDINKIDEAAIKKEVSDFKPSDANRSGTSGAGASCCQ